MSRGIFNADQRKAEAEALTNDVAEGVQGVVRVWNKAHNPNRAALSAGEHTIAVLQGIVICAGQQGAALAAANPGSDAGWLRDQLTEALGRAFDDTLAACRAAPASPREQ